MLPTIVVRDGTVLDGRGSPPRKADVAISGDTIVEVGTIGAVPGAIDIDARGCMVAPGFVNVLSHSYLTLQQDPRGLSDLYQGVTTQVFGEGVSLGPVTGSMTPAMLGLGAIPTGVQSHWPRLHDFLESLETNGVGFNVASFVGAANLRMVVAGVDNRLLSEQELTEACALLDEELENGALGVGSALIYPPGSYADSGELRAFSQVLARHDAVHICHLRSEGQRFLESIEELVDIARTTGARGEIYHLKVAGKSHWHKMSEALQLVESAREDGVRITADVYPYEAGNTLLSAALPPEFRCRDTTAGRTHLNSTGVREQIRERIHREDEDWENLYAASGGADGVTILSEVPALGIRAGEALGSIARRMGHHDPVDTVLAVLDALPTAEAAYFIASEDNTRIAFERPWVSVGSDADAQSTETLFAGQPVHPRSFGTFARILSRYTRGIGGQPVEECVRRMTSLPAENFGLAKRGYIAPGGYADLAIFDPSQVEDLATYDNPRVYATGMRHVVVNGQPALSDGVPTGKLAGRALRRSRNGFDAVR
ncbi:amidohydrolase family protein [Rhodococcus sp. 27YEA6]|uniref:N-acyl-D-amino-acid deacylase family protein n=1 Tax=Rhodococcus sp. 27YEA6 TaxID=3156273 RepID=UPI00384D3C96